MSTLNQSKNNKTGRGWQTRYIGNCGRKPKQDDTLDVLEKVNDI